MSHETRIAERIEFARSVADSLAAKLRPWNEWGEAYDIALKLFAELDTEIKLSSSSSPMDRLAGWHAAACRLRDLTELDGVFSAAAAAIVDALGAAWAQATAEDFEQPEDEPPATPTPRGPVVQLMPGDDTDAVISLPLVLIHGHGIQAWSNQPMNHHEAVLLQETLDDRGFEIAIATVRVRVPSAERVCGLDFSDTLATDGPLDVSITGRERAACLEGSQDE